MKRWGISAWPATNSLGRSGRGDTSASLLLEDKDYVLYITLLVLPRLLLLLLKIYFYFLLEYSCFTMLCSFLLYSKVNQLYTYIYPLFFRFFPDIYSLQSTEQSFFAMQQVLIGYLFYIQQCVYVNPNLSIYPSPTQFPLVTVVGFLHL